MCVIIKSIFLVKFSAIACHLFLESFCISGQFWLESIVVHRQTFARKLHKHLCNIRDLVILSFEKLILKGILARVSQIINVYMFYLRNYNKLL